MKKFFLLLASGSIAISGNAQMRTVDFTEHKLPGKTMRLSEFKKAHETTQNAAAKGTAAPTRRYNYPNFIDAKLDAETSQGIGLTNLPIWSDTTHQLTYSDGTTGRMTFMSTATVLDPSCDASFNNPTYYAGEMKITPTDAYRVDSVTLFGFYYRNSTSTSIVDTIRLSFLKGSGAASATEDIFSGYSFVSGHFTGATFLAMGHDSLLNIAMGATGTPGTVSPTVYIQDVYLNAASLGDTDDNGLWFKTIPLTTPINVAPNNFVGMGISYKTGESTPPGTVVHNFQTGVTTQGIWRPLVAYASDLVTPDDNPLWPVYSTTDSNMGYFKKFDGDIYIPALGWTASGGPSALQYPYVSWSLSCSTCGNVSTVSVANVANINKVNAYPNPANDELNIPFTLDATADVTVTLSNLLGQVVATKSMHSVSKGTATFNTENLPAGLYNYAVIANGNRTTGRVVVAH